MIVLKTAAIVALSALAFSLPALTGAETQLTAVVDGTVHEFPAIGNELYTRSCTIEIAFEDHSALAYCQEDGGEYRFDPEDNAWYVVK